MLSSSSGRCREHRPGTCDDREEGELTRTSLPSLTPDRINRGVWTPAQEFASNRCSAPGSARDNTHTQARVWPTFANVSHTRAFICPNVHQIVFGHLMYRRERTINPNAIAATGIVQSADS